MQKSTYPPEKITVKVQNNSQSASKKSVFQRLGSKSKLAAAGDLSLEEQCKELRRQIKMEGGGGSSTRKRAQKRHKESSSSSEDSSSGSSSDSSSSSSSSQSSPTRRRSKKARKPHHHSSSVDHLAAKIRKTSASSHRPVAKVPPSAASSSSSKLVKKHKSSRVVESPPPPPPTSSSRRRSASPASPSHRSRPHASHDLKKRDHHRSKELLHPKESSRTDRMDRDQHIGSSSSSRLQHDSRGRSRSPRHLARGGVRDQKRRLTPLETKRGHSPRNAPSNRSVDRDRERREKDREEREIARNKEREEALLRCQERQRERERVARERERKETRSREKSLDRDKPRMHLTSDRRSGGREVLTSSRGNYERRNSPPPGDSYEYDQRSTGGESYRASSSVGGRTGGHRESGLREPPGYEKEYVRGGGSSVRGRSPPPYEEVNVPPIPSRSAHEKFRGTGGVAGYEYEPREAGRGGGGGGGGYGEVRGWEEEKPHKVREPVPPRERILDRGAKEWSGPGSYRGSVGVDGPKEWSSGGGGGNKWEGQKFGSSSVGGGGGGGGGPPGRDDIMWPSNRGSGGIGGGESHLSGKPDNSWRNSGAYQEDGPPPSSTPSWKESHSTGGGGPSGHYGYAGHHNQQQHHSHAGPGQQQQQQQGPRMMMGPRYNDSWHHKPRFGAKKEFYPRHQFQAGGGGQHEGPGGEQQQSHPRFANQQKRFGDYQNFAPRGMMNQGPKFNAPTHGQQGHHAVVPSAQVAEKPRPEIPVATPVATPATTVTTVVTPSAKIEDVGTPTEDEKKTVPREGGTGGEGDLQEGDNLSEFSDDGDEILDKNETELRQQSQQSGNPSAVGLAADEAVVVGEESAGVKEEEKKEDQDDAQPEGDDDLTLDFEEISDGELEEESSKGLGDALGVDWAGLVAAAEPKESKPTGQLKTTVKEMWEPKRIFRDVGISVRMAGRELAERLLGQEVTEAVGLMKIKKEPLDEGEEEEEQLEENVKEELVKSSADVQVDLAANPIASCQVALRRRMLWRSNLIVNRSVAPVAGLKPVALCARRDLQIRRQLCGLPAAEIQLGGRGDEQQLTEMKALAMEVFVKATAAVH